MALVTGATGGGVQAPGRMQMPSVDYSLVAENDALSNISKGWKMGRDIAEYKTNRANELKQKAADIASAEAVAKSNATAAQVAAATADSKIQQINADNSLDAETKSQTLSGLQATRDQNLQIVKDNTDVLAKVTAARKQVGDQLADLTKLNTQVQLGEAQNKAANLPFEAQVQQEKNKVLTDVLSQMSKTGKPVSVDIGGGRTAVYTLTDKGLTSDVLQPLASNRQNFISTRQVQRPGAPEGVYDVLGTTADGREEVITGLSSKQGAAGSGAAQIGINNEGYHDKVDSSYAYDNGLPDRRLNPYRGQTASERKNTRSKLEDTDKKLDITLSAASQTASDLASGLDQWDAKMKVESTSPYFTWLPRGQDEKEMQTYSDQMLQAMKSPSWTGAVSDWEGKMFGAKLPSPDQSDEYNRQAIDVLRSNAVERVKDYIRFMNAWKGVYTERAGAQAAWDEYKNNVPTVLDYDKLKEKFAKANNLSGEKLEDAWGVEVDKNGYEKDRLYKNPDFIDSATYFRKKNAEAQARDAAVSHPAVGQRATQGGVTYEFDGQTWNEVK